MGYPTSAKPRLQLNASYTLVGVVTNNMVGGGGWTLAGGVSDGVPFVSPLSLVPLPGYPKFLLIFFLFSCCM